MKLTATPVPYSSVVGQSVSLTREDGSHYAMLSIHSLPVSADYKTASGELAAWLCELMNRDCNTVTDPIADAVAKENEADGVAVVLNGRNVTLDGLALEVMRVMEKQCHGDAKAAFDRGYAGGRRWGEEERQATAQTLSATAWDRILANDDLKATRAKLSLHELRKIIDTAFARARIATPEQKDGE